MFEILDQRLTFRETEVYLDGSLNAFDFVVAACVTQLREITEKPPNSKALAKYLSSYLNCEEIPADEPAIAVQRGIDAVLDSLGLVEADLKLEMLNQVETHNRKRRDLKSRNKDLAANCLLVSRSLVAQSRARIAEAFGLEEF